MRGADTIAAIATAPGRAGIGVVRISGPGVPAIGKAVLGELPPPRHARLALFREADGEVLDHGIALYFPAPGSYTGEDVLELQGHGGPIVLSLLLARCVALGARLAEPGEFTRRALLHDKLDLTQTEAVADLIDAASETAARSAMRSLSGVFSDRVAALQQKLTELRALLEASFDFSEEEIDLLAESDVAGSLEELVGEVDRTLACARAGRLLRDGLEVALVGPPNVGKSSLMNALAREEVAIVTPVAGTTRDPVRASVVLQGVPVHLTDTAGLRESLDLVESIGIERARAAAHKADVVLQISDAREGVLDLGREWPRVLHVHNKVDLAGQRARRETVGGKEHVWVSATEGTGLDLLAAALMELTGGSSAGEGSFSARQRHIDALRRTRERIERARIALHAPELAAEELRLGQEALSVLTGAQLPDDLLGEIFSRFCIGK